MHGIWRGQEGERGGVGEGVRVSGASGQRYRRKWDGKSNGERCRVDSAQTEMRGLKRERWGAGKGSHVSPRQASVTWSNALCRSDR